MHITETLGEIQITEKSKIVINFTMVGVKEKLDIRLWFKNFEGNWVATKKGFTIPKEKRQELLQILNRVSIADK